ncbi:phosphopantetheine-binding protein [Chloroflexota bacterium]
MTPLENSESRIKMAIAKVFHKPVSEISRDTRFVADLFAKSINTIELIAILDYEFDIKIPRAQARRAKTVGEAIDLIEGLIK